MDGHTEGRMEKQMEEQKVRQTLFHRTQLNGLSLIGQAKNSSNLWIFFQRLKFKLWCSSGIYSRAAPVFDIYINDFNQSVS